MLNALSNITWITNKYGIEKKDLHSYAVFQKKKQNENIFSIFAKTKEMKNQRIYLCLAHMSGNEMKYIQEAFDANWVVPLRPNVNGVSESLFKTGLCLPSGPCVSEEDAKYIVEQMKSLCE